MVIENCPLESKGSILKSVSDIEFLMAEQDGQWLIYNVNMALFIFLFGFGKIQNLKKKKKGTWTNIYTKTRKNICTFFIILNKNIYK